MSAPSLCLVVDDSRVIRHLASDLLKSFGFSVAEAENGKVAVEFCRTKVPSFVLLDWNMPEMDGISCLKALRAMPLEPRPSVVMCTTENTLDKIREALEAGADEFIMKPYDREVLLDKLVQIRTGRTGMTMQASALPAATPLRVMVVDNSAIVRGLITRILTSDTRIEVAASCSNGQMAVAQAARKAMDVIILDIEMPVMDGLAALPKLQEVNPHARIIMASTLTQRNAAISLKALTLGATDYIAKPTTDRLNASEEFRRDLVQKVIALGQKKNPVSGATRPHAAPALSPHAKTAHRPRIIAIGSSTGGPQALLNLLGALPATVECPIVIAQHMPATFTTVLAQHIARASNRPCAEAADGMEIKPGTICLAPGDYHLQLTRQGTHLIARLSQTPPENFCRPSVDPLFRSVAQLFGAESCGVILTGMGSDGCSGARAMAAAGAPIIAQDEATSVVWGMPGAVANAGICSAILPLPRIAPHLANLCAREAA